MKQFSRNIKHKILILEKKQRAWEEKYFCFASIKDISEGQFNLHENIDFGVLLSKNYKILRTRFLRDISKNMRIKINNDLYEILKIINEKEANRISQILVSQI
jgi:hypothetical protein